MDKTIKWIEKEFETLANAHDKIHSFVCDDFLSAYDSGKLNHVSMIVFASNSSASENNDLITFRVHVCDKVFDDQTNVQSVRSDTFQILRDIYNVVRHSRRWNSFSSVKSAAPFTYFRELGQDQVDGWFMDITLQVSDAHNLCAIPLDDYDFARNYASACEPVTILIGGVFYTTAASGTTVNITSTGGNVIIKNSIDEIIATVAAPDTYIVADSTITLQNSNLTTLSTTSVPATNNETINVPDTPYTLKNSSGTDIGSGSFPSGESGVVISPDASVENSDASFAINAKSGITTIISDITITAKNSENTTVATNIVPAAVNAEISIGDSTISNSDDSYSVILAAEKALELPDVTMTKPNGTTESYPSVKNYTCTQIGALANSDLISQLTDAQLKAVLEGRVQQRVVEYTSGSGTYTTPSDLIFAFVVCIGAGGGGGSGRRGTTTTSRFGGGGGASGTIARRWFTASQLGVSKAYAVGSGGGGGAGQTADTNNGNAGTKGGDTTFGGTDVVAIGGNPGQGGTTAVGTGGTAVTITSITPSQFPLSLGNTAGAAGNAGTANNAQTNCFSAILGNNGGGGGGVNASNSQGAGGSGSTAFDRSQTLNTAATAGTAGGGAGGNGTNNQSLQLHVDYVSGVPLNTIGFGTSGGGGGGNNAGGGGAGGNGGNYGAGGGGGGGTTNGTTGGNGGDGAGGAIIIFEYYV